MLPTTTLLISCADQKGLVAAVTGFIAESGGNILDLDQHVDQDESMFFMRVKWDMSSSAVTAEDLPAAFNGQVGSRYGMHCEFSFSNQVPRIALFATKLPHCVFDILSRISSGEWNTVVPVVISNHETLKGVAEKFGIEYVSLPVNDSNKKSVEEEQLHILKKHRVDFIVLARYMRVLSPEFIKHYPGRIINIHHSFLPAFPGAKPYHKAHERGVKIIGATSHYVTDDLDAGPIIEQGVVRVSHRDSVDDMIRLGYDLEKVVLAKAVWKHLQRKLLVYKNKTVNFD